MAIDVAVTDAGVRIELTGMDRIWALRRVVEIARTELEAATVMSRKAARASLGWRLGGTALPGAATLGNYTFRPAREGERQFWAVYRDREVLVIDTTIARPRRVVVQHPDRVRLAREISALVTR